VDYFESQDDGPSILRKLFSRDDKKEINESNPNGGGKGNKDDGKGRMEKLVKIFSGKSDISEEKNITTRF
jgi:hypothetical protein